MVIVLAGCATNPYSEPASPAQSPRQASQNAASMNFNDPTMTTAPLMQGGDNKSIVLREGDMVKVTLPDSPNLSTEQQIRRDGRIVLPLIGEVQAAGSTPEQLQAELIKAYSPQISTKEIVVNIVNSSFPVFVTGGVLRPGKILVNHPMMPLEAVMEAGGFAPNADKKHVRIVREINGQVQKFDFNLKAVINGSQNETFFLQPSDMIFVPEKFTWF